ncbi:MAG: hypothetical protein QW757_02615 [Candidatus Woesearchaeota archaeon]
MKKAQFFIIDAIFSIIILIMGYLMLFSNFKIENQQINIESQAENIYKIFSEIKAQDLCFDNYCNNKKLEELYLNNEINLNQTLLDVFAELYYKNKKDKLFDLIENITLSYDLIDERYGIKIFINKEEVFSKGKNFLKAKEKITRQAIIFSFYENKETGSFIKYGPYIIEIIIWNEI